MEININPNIDDNFYRYKMPDLIIKNDTKLTKIVNLNDIATVLNIPSTILLKYFSVVLGTNSNHKKLTINGKYDKKHLLNTLYKFIESYIICKKCTIPELNFTYNNKDINITCSACGQNYKMESTNNIDLKIIDQFKTHIKKNGPIMIKTYQNHIDMSFN
uniref:Translation initiation factor IF2/IF5 domain-containing protein n=1 Tax=Megaviridae environmental sample TaxID=1737588 RepID=A0A5J6VK95_9VIRU|nr:MAG: hypothetical protein [Megaviridae environmental sample]